MKQLFNIVWLSAITYGGIASGADLKFGLDFNNIAEGNSTGIVFENKADDPCTGRLSRTQGYANWVQKTTGDYAHTMNGSTFQFSNIEGLDISKGLTISFDAACKDEAYSSSNAMWADLITFSIGEATYKVESGGNQGAMDVYQGSSGQVLHGEFTLSPNTAYNLQITLSSTAYTLNIYDKNGTLLETNSHTTDIPTSGLLTMIKGGGTQVKTGWWIDNVAIYDGVLSADEARQVAMTNGLIQSTTAAPVPEPAASALGLLALAGLCGRRRRK